MCTLMAPPFTQVEYLTDVLHGTQVVDPYRWLEDQDSPQTRAWIAEQTVYARNYLDSIAGRERIRQRIRGLLDVETCDSFLSTKDRYFFRKRLVGKQQPAIYMREAPEGHDQLLLDPAARGTGNFTAVKPLRVSPDGQLLLYEVKQGGERTGTFEILDVADRKTLPDILPRGYLRGFAFAPDGGAFYYVHEPAEKETPSCRTVRHHLLRTPFASDREIFTVPEEKELRLELVSDHSRLGVLVYRFTEPMRTSFYLLSFNRDDPSQTVLEDADFAFGPIFVPGTILAITNRNAPNYRIVELRAYAEGHTWLDVVPETADRIDRWAVAGDRLFVSYVHQTSTHVLMFGLSGNKLGEMPIENGETVRLPVGVQANEEVLVETESFTRPISTFRFSPKTGKRTLLATRNIPFNGENFSYLQTFYTSKDGTSVPISLVGRREILAGRCSPAILTSYGGYGASMTPQFSVFVAFLVEHGCLFALPNIRGGSEFGVDWHHAARRRKRQTAYDDFLCAAEWLVRTGRTSPQQLAIFGGSNAGLLVAAAMTQRPDLFRAVVCMVPMTDMLRYHLFDNAFVWREEYGVADDPDDFAALLAYSPYHNIRAGTKYPATLVVSGDADRNCNAMHARKMTARLQSANLPVYPIILDYNSFRGHSPVLPLSVRIDALTDRMAFLCEQLQVQV